MVKRLMAAVAAVAILVLTFGSAAVFGEGETPAVPSLTFTLNADGTTSVKFIQEIEGENADETITRIEENFTQDGYTVTRQENPTAVAISKTYPADKGYFLDLTLPYGLGESSFVQFTDFFSNRYGIKSTAFNTEQNQEGRTYLTLTIETPVKPAFSNAATRDATGKINTWEIISASTNEINLTFKKYNIIPLLSTIFIAVLVLALICVGLTAKKRNAASREDGTAVDSGAIGVTGAEDADGLENPIENMEFDVVRDAEEPNAEQEADGDASETEPEIDGEIDAELEPEVENETELDGENTEETDDGDLA
ncbi:MAG: hypothetical protein LBH54_01500 [Clostridiales bacterium]|jgi:hypothetical protein|nr:hypothetical protein [Clostridiales bacterium]